MLYPYGFTEPLQSLENVAGPAAQLDEATRMWRQNFLENRPQHPKAPAKVPVTPVLLDVDGRVKAIHRQARRARRIAMRSASAPVSRRRGACGTVHTASRGAGSSARRGITCQWIWGT